MKKLVPDTLLIDREQVRLPALSMWVLDRGATEIVITEAIAVMPRLDDRACFLNVLA
jgi:hypothetical protein